MGEVGKICMTIRPKRRVVLCLEEEEEVCRALQGGRGREAYGANFTFRIEDSPNPKIKQQ